MCKIPKEGSQSLKETVVTNPSRPQMCSLVLNIFYNFIISRSFCHYERTQKAACSNACWKEQVESCYPASVYYITV